MSNALAMILAGGHGKRMDILCHTRPKPAMPFAGRFKVIDFSLSNCIYSNIDNIAVLVDYQRSQMTAYLKRWQLMHAGSTNFRVLAPQFSSYSGTADAAYQNLEYLDKSDADAVLILAGDHVYKFDYRKMLNFHREVDADVTVGVIPVPIEQAHRFGTVTIGADGRITDFREKSSTPKSNLASMGIYVFNKKILIERLIEDSRDILSRHDFGYSLLPKMARRDRAFAYRFQGYWQDIGTIDAYYEANMELTKEQPSFSLNGSSPILTEEESLPPPCIGKQASIKNSLVSPGCVIRGRVENSVLSPRVWVDEEAVVKNSVIMNGAFIGRHSIVNHCVLDEGVKVGDYCYIGFGFSLVNGSWYVTVLGKGATVPPHTAIGRNCKILPYVGPEDFTSNMVRASAVIARRSKVLTH